MSDLTLDLDEVPAAPTKTLKIGGTSYASREMTVQGYLDRVKRAQGIEPSDPGTQTEQTIALIRDVFPDLPEETLRSMTVGQLSRVIDFALASPETIAKRAEQSSQDNSTPAEGVPAAA